MSRVNIQSESDQTRRDDLIEEYREYVHNIVHKLIKSMGLPKGLFEEFVASGYLGLVEAAERYDFNAGVEFRHFAFLRIRGAVIDSIRQTSQLSGKAYRYARALQGVEHLNHEALLERGTRTGDEMLARIFEFAAKAALVHRLSMTEEASKLENLPSGDVAQDEVIGNRQSIEKLRAMLETLPEKERTILREYYFEGKSFVDVARKYGDSKSWVSRLHTRALRLLKEQYMAAEPEGDD